MITVEATSNTAVNAYYFIDPAVQGIDDITFTVSCIHSESTSVDMGISLPIIT